MNFPPEQMARLYDGVRAIHSTLEPEAALRLVVCEAVGLVGAASGSLVLVNPNTGRLEIEVSEGPAPVLEEGIAGWVVRHGESLRVGKAAAEDRFASARPGTQSELAVPLRMEGSVRGVIHVDAPAADAFSEMDQVLLEELAVHATQVIHNTWLYEQLRQSTELLESLVSVGQTINRTLNLDDVLEAITREAAGLGRARACSLQLLDATSEWLEVRAQHGAGIDYQQRPPLSVAESLMGAVVRRRKPVQVGDLQTSAQYQHAEIARREGFVSLLSVPLVYSEDCLGTLNIYTAAPHVFSNEEVNTLAALAELSAVAIEKARLYERTVDGEEQLRRNEQLSALGLLAAEVAHEIRNPLTVMKMLYHSLDLQFPEGDPRREDARVLGDKMNHLDRIVDNIVNFARNAEPRMAPVDVPGLIDDLALLTRHKLQQHSIGLEREDAPDLSLVKADATQLSQAFLNVILNATEAMPEGGTLRITTRREDGELQVAFADTGPGMTDAQRARAFTGMLSTTKEKGGGLGLAIVAKVAEAHGGRVKLESVEGQGTEITVCFAAE